MRKLCQLVLIVTSPILAFAQDQPDAAIMKKIREEGLERSQVMDIAFRLTDVSGPRLTNSPGYKRAADYATKQLTQWGLQNARLEPWGEFGKGWELSKSYLALTAPYYRPLIAFPLTWTAGTKGLRSAQVLLITGSDSAYIASLKGKLKGKILITDRADEYKQSFKPDANRFTDEQLQAMQDPASVRVVRGDTAARRRELEQARAQYRTTVIITPALRKMAAAEGALAILVTGGRNHDGTIFVQGGGSYAAADPENFTTLSLTLEDYMPLVRLLKANIPVKLDLDVATKFFTADTKAYNVIAEIPGSDPKLKPELVMLGGHLDSWQAGTGATDNASGCAVMMEAVRILQAIGVKPRRTVRIALWSGEEQGLLGSRAYVRNTFPDEASRQNFSAYYNLDNGTGKIRGIYLQQNKDCGPIFSAWLEPFKDLGAGTVTINNTGGTDHQAFDGINLPGFQFIQDPIEYNTRTHHSNMDTYDHLVADDLKQAAVIVAAFVYNTAQREEKLPRKPLPQGTK
ncbi:M20/M25/M40 family metallo-hydrolase [Chitinophaga horti]|uniref:Carboxypeptidase Q n=1 Tax=Chitinophaga horti TaxID=2920382 RepID=A0ABY6J5T7_9BACT|nr:M20/M25/M40 family metallo-hydrolase [Chitinophaga horti]UYQ95040.1 M20/M25/M40 family metallo-hydrolase [Chitinophaga horti]